MLTVPPLTTLDEQEVPYARRPAVEGLLERLWNLPVTQRDAELESGVMADGAELPIEALLHFSRAAWRQGDRATYQKLFRVLYARVEGNVSTTVFSSRIATADAVRQAILDRFVNRLADDCSGKAARLDYFEVNFAHGLACTRASILREFDRKNKRTVDTVPLTSEDPQTGEQRVPPEAEAATAEFLLKIRSKFGDPAFRSDLFLAIDVLPADQREVVLLSVDGMQSESADKKKMSIAQTLNCTSRTVHNLRVRATAALRVALKEWNLDE